MFFWDVVDVLTAVDAFWWFSLTKILPPRIPENVPVHGYHQFDQVRARPTDPIRRTGRLVLRPDRLVLRFQPGVLPFQILLAYRGAPVRGDILVRLGSWGWFGEAAPECS